MVTPITNMFQELAAYGILDSLLPFMLVFAIIYAILNKAQIFKSATSSGKNFNIIVALVMGLAVVIPHVMGMQPDVVNIINNALPQVSVVVIAIVMVLLIIGIWAPPISWLGGIQGWTVLIAIVAVVYIFGNSMNFWTIPAFLYFFQDPQFQSLVVIFLVFAVIIWFITAPDQDEKNKKSWLESFALGGDSMGRIFGIGKP